MLGSILKYGALSEKCRSHSVKGICEFEDSVKETYKGWS